MIIASIVISVAAIAISGLSLHWGRQARRAQEASSKPSV